jgi:uncharacterized protein (DUF305 family)
VSTAVTLLVAALLAGCGAGEWGGRPMSGDPGPGTSATATTADHGRADVMFSAMMIPHHEQAVEMAAMVPSRSEDPDLRTLATAVREAQQPEIEQMQAWLREWGVAPAGDMSDHMGHMGMDGMLSAAELDELEGLSGTTFERAWLEGMVRHHEGAIDMAEQVLEDGVHEPTRQLARTVITTQSAEITQMREMLAALGG